MNNHPIGVLLAAGQSRRFGSNKLQQPLADGTPVLIASAKNLCAVTPHSIVVVNPTTPSHLIQQLEELELQIVVNEHAKTGIGSSIARGVAASAHASSWIFALADMPFIHPDTIKIVSDALLDGAGIVTPVYQQQRGHPVGFASRHQEELLALNGDTGARHIITKHLNELVAIDVEDRGVIWDIDSLVDLQTENQIS